MTLTQINKAGLDEIALDHVFTIGASGNSAYTFQGEGLNGTVNNPTLYLTRGKTYRFENGSGGHPIRIQSTSGASGTAYNTGVTNNAGSGTVIVEVQHDAPDVLYYQCTSHAAMNGILYITGALADGGVTTAKLADDAVTYAKIQNVAQDRILGRQSSGSGDVQELNATNVRLMLNVENGATADQTKSDIDALNVKAGTIDVQSTSSNFNYDVVFANGSGDKQVAIDGSQHIKYNPSSNTLTTGVFEGSGASLTNLPAANLTGTLPAIDGSNLTGITSTTINNNADNRVITGSGTANTLNGESNVTINSDGDLLVGRTSTIDTSEVLGLKGPSGDHCTLGLTTDGTTNLGIIAFNDSNANFRGQIRYSHSNDTMQFQTANSERFTIDEHIIKVNDGDIVIGTSGHGINFDTAGSGSDQLLNDYEEGTWTPVCANGGLISVSPSSNRYTKIGRMVFACGRIAFGSSGSGATTKITLPFTPDSNVTASAVGSACFEQSYDSNNTVMACINDTGGVIFRKNGSGNLKNDQLAGTILRFCVYYMAV